MNGTLFPFEMRKETVALSMCRNGQTFVQYLQYFRLLCQVVLVDTATLMQLVTALSSRLVLRLFTREERVAVLATSESLVLLESHSRTMGGIRCT